MPISNLLDRFYSSRRERRRREKLRGDSARKSLSRRRAILETLEDRRVLASFAVITAGDAGSGTCSESACTLRDAVSIANTTAGADEITFDSSITGTIVLTPANGSLVVTDPVTINGPGASVLTVDADASEANEFRIFDIESTAGDVSISGLTLSGGQVDSNAGGAIRFRSSGTLAISSSTITGNSANNGGAIYSEYDGTISITGSDVSGNTATYGAGGAIQNVDGDITIENSTINSNTSYGSGGAISSPNTGAITISGTDLNSNTVTQEGYHGGAIYSGEGSVTISSSNLTGNTSAGDGGGLYSIRGDMTITSSTFDNNESGYNGGALFNDDGAITITDSSLTNNGTLYGDGGAISNIAGDLTLTASTVSDNQSVTDGGGISNVRGQVIIRSSSIFGNTSAGDGGGIATVDGPLTLINSTISGNSANIRGGGIQNDYADVRIINSTIALNNAFVSGGGIGTLNDGIFVSENSGSILIHNSIVATNTTNTPGSGADFVAPLNADETLEVRSSLIGRNDLTTLTASASPDADGNLIGTSAAPIDPLLQPLAANQGPTQSHLPSFSSPVVDRGDNALALDLGDDGAPGGGDDTPLTSDQRGGLLERVVNSGGGILVDMGAVELQPLPQLEVDNIEDESDGNLANGDRSLREMIELANSTDGFDTIVIRAGLDPVMTLNAALGTIEISDSVSIIGPGADALTIQRNLQDSAFRLFDVTDTAVNVNIINVSLSGGDAGSEDGGAIRFGGTGQLLLKSSQATGNSAASGGAIAATSGTVAIAGSTIANSSASNDGGGIAMIGTSTSLVVVDSTISTNIADGRGGGVFTAGADVSVSSSTITLNQAGDENAGEGGGIFIDASTAASLQIDNSIVAANLALTGADFVAPGDPGADLDVNFSLVGSNDSTSLTASTLTDGVPDVDTDGNFVGGDSAALVDPLLGPLQSNAGPTLTHSPQGTSLVVDAGSGTVLPVDTFDLDGSNTDTEPLPVDQRGAVRAVDQIDMGAVELAPLPTVDWAAPDPIDFGTELSSTQLNASSNDPGSFVYTPDLGTVLDAGDGQVLTVTFLPTNPLAFRSVELTQTIDVNQADPGVTWEAPDPIVFGTLLSATELDATSLETGEFVYTPAEGTLLDAGMQTLSVTFTPDDANFRVVTQTVTLEVQKAVPEITWATPDAIVFGTALDDTQLNATAEFNTAAIAGDFVYTPATDTILDAGDDQELSVTFTPTGDDADNFESVTATVMIDVTKADPLLSWSDPDAIGAGTELDDTQLNATASFAGESLPGTFVYTPASGTVLDVGDGQVLSVTFTATGDAADNFNPATTTVTIDVFAVGDGEDFGDAPSTYPVLLADDGARHELGTLRLGTQIDAEDDGQPSAAADGDDSDGDDEDGVSVLADPVASSDVANAASFMVEASGAGLLDAWVDFNGNGDWDSGEQIATSLAVNAGANVLSYTVPEGAQAGETFARFRISTAGGLAPTGAASDGEVEDYSITILDGTAGSDAVVNLPSGDVSINTETDNVVVRSGTTVLFQAPVASLTKLSAQGGESDDTVTLGAVTLAGSGIVEIDGGGGTNKLVVSTTTLDATDTAKFALDGFDEIEMSGDDVRTTLTLNASIVSALSPTSETITVTGGRSDQIVFSDAEDWAIDSNEVVDGKFVIVLTNQETGQQVRSIPFSGWQNPIESSDINDRGGVTAGDALLIINELARQAFSDENGVLVDPATLDPFPGDFYDQNGNGTVTALDALLVINRLAELLNESGNATGEQIPVVQSTNATPAGISVADDVDNTVEEHSKKICDATLGDELIGEEDLDVLSQEREDEMWATQVDALLSDLNQLL